MLKERAEMKKTLLTVFVSMLLLAAIFGRLTVTIKANPETICLDASNINDPLEDESWEHPFDRMREGVESKTIPEDTWTVCANAPIPSNTTYAVAAMVEGIIYVMGYVPTHWLSWYGVSTMVAYDSSTDTWRTKTPMPTPRDYFAAASLDGLVYAIGGREGREDSSVVEVYDPLTDAWTRKSSMSTPRLGLGAAVVDGVIYAMGGHKSLANEVYNPSTDTWTTKTPVPGGNWGRFGFATVTVDNLIYIMGGDPEDITTNDVYDPLTDTWSRIAPMPTGRSFHSAEYVGNAIYVIGGYSMSIYGIPIPLSSNEAYDPLSNTWLTSLAPLPTARWGFAHANVNGTIYIIGGKNSSDADSKYLSINEAYTVYSGNKQKPFAQLSASLTTIVQGAEVIFDGSACGDLDGSIVSYWYDYGDGSSSGWTTETIQYWSYSEPGEYNAKLKVKDNDGLISGWSSPVKIIVLHGGFEDLSVPYEAQGNAPWCWAASTAMILRYYGKSVHVWDIGRDLYSVDSLGQIELYVHNKYPGEFETRIGVYSSVSDRTRQDIEGNLSIGYPVMLRVFSLEMGAHMVIVTGYNSSGFFINDPSGALFIKGLGRASSFPYIHEFSTWEDLKPFIDKDPFGAIFLVLKETPSPLDATLSFVDDEGIRTIHDSDNKYGVCIDYGDWYWAWDLDWRPINWHPSVWDPKDTLRYIFEIFNHKNQEERFDFHLWITGEDKITYYERSILDVSVSAFDFEPVTDPTVLIPLKDYLIEGQRYVITAEIRYHGSQDIIESITLPPIDYGVKSITFTAECPVRMLVTDPDGLQVGFDPASNQTVNEILDAVYYYGNKSETELISIPKQKDGNYSVIVFGIESGTYNLTCTTLDETGFLSTDFFISTPIEKDETQTYVIPEFPPFLILPLFMIMTLLAVIVCRRKHPI